MCMFEAFGLGRDGKLGYIRSFMTTTGEGVYHHGIKNMISGPVILRNRSFQVEDFIFVHFTRHTFQVANTLDLAF